MNYIVAFIFALVVSMIFTVLVRKLAFKLNILDQPNSERKIHKKAIPLLGGVAIFFAYFLSLFLFRKYLLVGDLNLHHWLGFFTGAIFLLIGGVLDDKYNLSPKLQIIWPVLASLAIVLGGVNIEKISGLNNNFIYFPFWVSSAFIFLWLLGMTYTTKLLDGLDGLASGISAIGSLIIFLFTITTKYYQPDIALASLLFFAVLLGFLVFNFNPAKIFLGESGSLLIGYILGVLAIISGGKIAIALLVIGLPALDVLWTIIRRLLSGKNPFRSADRKHLHHRLIDLGLSQKQAVLSFYAVSGFFGLSALFLQSRGKIWALALLFLLMVGIIIFFYLLDKKKKKLLLHICCAPCGAYLISEKLLKNFSLTLYFSNSNIDTLEEYEKRLFWVKELAKKYNLPLEVEAYNHASWLDSIRGLEKEPERGPRCHKCYQLRLEKTAILAKERGMELFYTTLVTSPYKDLEKIKDLGNNLAKKYQISFLDLEFDRDEMYQASVKMAKDSGFYRQKYCGCEF